MSNVTIALGLIEEIAIVEDFYDLDFTSCLQIWRFTTHPALGYQNSSRRHFASPHAKQQCQDYQTFRRQVCLRSQSLSSPPQLRQLAEKQWSLLSTSAFAQHILSFINGNSTTTDRIARNRPSLDSPHNLLPRQPKMHMKSDW